MLALPARSMEGVRPGRLRLKGQGRPAKRVAEVAVPVESRSPPKREREPEPTVASALPEVSVGSGRIRTSGTTVTGVGTRFRREVRPGDALRVIDPVSAKEELRVVSMVVSDESAGISSAFPNAITDPSPFSVVRLPKSHAVSSEPKRSRLTEDSSFAGEYSGREVTVRVKHGGGYKIVKRPVAEDDGGSEVSRERLLDARSRLSRDKFC
jgi:hypothetical protein